MVCIGPGLIPVEQEAENRIIKNIFLSFMVTIVLSDVFWQQRLTIDAPIVFKVVNFNS